jgi:hypothetical protein
MIVGLHRRTPRLTKSYRGLIIIGYLPAWIVAGYLAMAGVDRILRAINRPYRSGPTTYRKRNSWWT